MRSRELDLENPSGDGTPCFSEGLVLLRSEGLPGITGKRSTQPCSQVPFYPPLAPQALPSHALHPLPQPGCKFPATQKAGIRPIIPSSSKLTNPSGSALPCTKHLWLKGKLCKACSASQGNPSLNSLSSEWPGQEMLCQVSF